MISRSSLSRHGDFRRFWAAQTVSDFGARITREGLPMMAVLTLAATPSQLGLLAALTGAPTVLVGLSAGGFVDRTRRRRVLMGSDLVRAFALASIPLAAWGGHVTIVQIYLVAALVAAASSLFDIADHAYLPSLVGRDQITAANTRLSATESAAEMGGPALAGLLFQALSAPFAVAFNAATYVVSAAFLGSIRVQEPDPEPDSRHGWLDGARAGFAAAWTHPLVRPLLAMSMASGLFGGVFSALYVVFALRTLNLAPALLGLAIAAGGASALMGSVLARPMAERLGLGPAILISAFVAAGSALLVPLAPAQPVGAMAFLVISQLLGDAFGVASLILGVSLRQNLLPQKMLGRTAAAFQAGAGATAIAGALAGGLIGHTLGVRSALAIAAAGLAVAPAIGLLSPLRRLRKMPDG